MIACVNNAYESVDFLNFRISLVLFLANLTSRSIVVLEQLAFSLEWGLVPFAVVVAVLRATI